MAVRHACLLRAVSMGGPQRWRSTPTAVFHRRKSPGRDANTDIARALRRRLFASVTLGPIDSRYSETLAALFHSLLPYERLVKHALSFRSHVQTTIFPRCCSTKANKLAEFPTLTIFFVSAGTPRTISERCVEASRNRRSSAFRDRSTRGDLYGKYGLCNLELFQNCWIQVSEERCKFGKNRFRQGEMRNDRERRGERQARDDSQSS